MFAYLFDTLIQFYTANHTLDNGHAQVQWWCSYEAIKFIRNWFSTSGIRSRIDMHRHENLNLCSHEWKTQRIFILVFFERISFCVFESELQTNSNFVQEKMIQNLDQTLDVQWLKFNVDYACANKHSAWMLDLNRSWSMPAFGIFWFTWTVIQWAQTCTVVSVCMQISRHGKLNTVISAISWIVITYI